MRVLDLFSGIGGFSLGLERAGMKTVAFCEINQFCQKVLKKHWPDIPIYNDIRTIDYDGAIELICGGFPCQPFSVAGKQAGNKDDRHLWPAMLDCIKKYKPRWVIGENVTGIINMELDTVLIDLENEGYACKTFIIPACAVNAPHRRNRVWVIAHSRCQSEGGAVIGFGDKQFNCKKTNIRSAKRNGFADVCKNVANASSERQQGQGELKQRGGSAQDKKRQANIIESMCIGNQWSTEPDVGRVANGIPYRVDRLKSLGNAVVPQIPEIIGRAIMSVENQQLE